MIKLHPASHRIETAFILALFTMFAATAFLVVLIGAKQYQITADSMNVNYEVRTAASYLEEKVRQNDCTGAIYATELLGVPALAIQTAEDDTVYTTYIYYYEDCLRELFVTDSSVYSLASGQMIIELSGFEVESLGSDFIRATYIGTDGISYTVYLSVHAAAGKEEV
jgi:preprotein translocase subunit SecY